MRRQARRLISFVNVLVRLCYLIKKLRIDVVDGHTGPGNLMGVVAARLTGARAVVTTYDVEQWEPRWLWTLLYRGVLTHAHAVITDSEFVASAVNRFLRSPRRVDVIPNGLPPPVSERNVTEMRAELGLPQDQAIRIIGQISTLHPQKGHMVLIEAARIILDRCSTVAFLIVGFPRQDPAYRNRLEQRAAELDISRNVRIVGYPGDIADVWKVIDIQAHPTLWDSLPNAIIEGMALGKPVVATPIGGIPTIIEHGRTGFIVPPDDPAALADALLRLLGDPELARHFGRRAFERYQLQYTQQAMTERLQAAFARVCG